MRYTIKLSYDGSAFNGWQVQPNAPSVQETIEKAISTLTGTQVGITGAGRTDSGVNAIGYTAHFDCPEERIPSAEQLGYKLNAILPGSIVVHEVKSVSESFHARFGATRREYAYFLHRKKDPFAEKFSLRCSFDLDVDAMNLAAQAMLGRHDFSSFEKVGADNKTSICTVFEAKWECYTPQHVSLMGFPAQEGDYLVFRISADRFLRNMVRATVGTLLEVGRGKRSVDDFCSLIFPEGGATAEKGAARCRAGESVSGKALFLCGVKYE